VWQPRLAIWTDRILMRGLQLLVDPAATPPRGTDRQGCSLVESLGDIVSVLAAADPRSSRSSTSSSASASVTDT
jgi:hypothetical protein